MTEIKDKILYEKVKKEIYLKYPKHSAYRSGLLVKKYKEEYYKNIKKMMRMKVKKKILKG